MNAVQHEQVASADADGQDHFEKAVSYIVHGVQGAVDLDLYLRGGCGPQAKTGALAAGQGCAPSRVAEASWKAEEGGWGDGLCGEAGCCRGD